MYLRIAALFCAVLWLGSTAMAQDSRNKMIIEQQIRMQQLQQQGKLTEAQKQALQMKMMQNLRGQKTGPKTGVYPTQPMQGNMTGGQAPRNDIQAEKSRAALRKKAEAKKSKKGDEEKKEKKEDPKAKN